MHCYSCGFVVDKSPCPNCGEDINDYSDMFWGGWSRDIHYIDGQRDLIEKSFGINPDKTEIYGDEGVINGLEVTLSSCECKSFLKRRLPCHHIYFLANESLLPMPNSMSNYRINHDDFENWLKISDNISFEKFASHIHDGDHRGGWSPTIHKYEKQKERPLRSEVSGQYQTDLKSCTCIDFTKRRLPCKHIYDLAFQNKLPLK